MNSFSISAYEHQPMLDYYKQWLVRDLYSNISLEKLDDPTFLQKLSIIQADGIRRDIGIHAAITHNSIQEASTEVGRKIQIAANLITSSLDDGFSLMNQRMMEVNSNLGVIGHGIGEVNNTLRQSNQILTGINSGIAQTNQGIAQLNRGIGVVASGMNTLNQNMVSGMNALNHNIVANLTALGANISQVASMLNYQLQQTENVLQAILDELKIPESQRERRYHIEEGMKYFNKGMRSGDCLYFEDALEEFTTATAIERKDFFSWYYIGMIHLYSKDHLDFDKALSAFDRYTHYADAMVQRHPLFDEALMMKAECYYLKQDVQRAYQIVEAIALNNTKAALRSMKYLSASNSIDKRIQAVEVLKRLMQQNPYIVMQVLEDYDIANNEFILQYIRNYYKEIMEEISKNKTAITNSIDVFKSWCLVYNKCRDRISLSTSSVVDAIRTKETLPSIRKQFEMLATIFEDINRNLEFLQGYQYIYNNYIKEIELINAKFVSDDNSNNVEVLKNELLLLNEKIKLIVDAVKHGRQFDQVRDNNRIGFECCGQIIIPCQWKASLPFVEDLAAVQDDNGMWGFIDKSGIVVIPCQWVSASPFNEGLAIVRDSNWKYCYINKEGNMAFPGQRWTFASLFSEGLAAVSNDKFGYIDKNGHVIIPYQWKCAWEFQEGLAAIESFNNKWGFIDKSGQVIIPCRWKKVASFSRLRGFVRTIVWDFNDNKHIIDKTGKIVG